MADAYLRQRQVNQDVGVARVIATTDTTISGLITARSANHTIYIQKIHVKCTVGNASKTWTFQDSANTPVPVTDVIAVTNAGNYDYDFGPNGTPLTAGKNLDLSISGAGAGGRVVVEAYQRLSSTINTGTTNTQN